MDQNNINALLEFLGYRLGFTYFVNYSFTQIDTVKVTYIGCDENGWLAYRVLYITTQKLTDMINRLSEMYGKL